MIENIAIGVIVKLLELFIKWLSFKAEAATKKLEKDQAHNKKTEHLTKRIDDAVEKSERISAALDALNKSRM